MTDPTPVNRTSSPPVRALPAIRPADDLSRLPTPPTSFIGREREIRAISDLLRGGEVRLLTLIGPGGSGKTRLALRVASSLANEFQNSAVFVSLAAIQDPALILPAIAQALGVAETAEQSLFHRLEASLRDQHLLLVVDNLEHLVDAAAPLLARFITNCPTLYFLCTSRARLELSGEHVVPVGALEPDDARTLFVVRAREVTPVLTATTESETIIDAICTRLDRLPLAIELAAARTPVLPLAALLARLDHRLPLLTKGPRDTPARQRTLRAAIDWSHNLLTDDERALFRRLAVFAGGASLDAVETVTAIPAAQHVDVLDCLGSLIDKSLLRQEAGPDDAPRYWMLESIREYGLEQLVASGEETDIRDRHAAWCLELAETAAPHLRRREQVNWFARLEVEHDNLRSALGWLRERGEVSKLLRLGGALWFFWWMRGYYTEGAAQLAALLALSGVESRTPARARVLNGAGVIALWMGDAGRSAALHEDALALARELGDDQEAAFALVALSTTLSIGASDYARAAAAAAESLALARAASDLEGVALAAGNLALILDIQGKAGEAAPLYQEALAIRRDLGDRWSLNILLNNLGARAAGRGEKELATSYFEESLKLAREVADRRGITTTLCNLVHVITGTGDHQRALELAREAQAISSQISDLPMHAAAAEALARVLRACGHEGAIAASQQALQLYQRVGDRVQVASCLTLLASLCQEPAQAARLIGASNAIRSALGTPAPPSMQEEIDNLASTLRSILGMGPYETAVNEGLRLTIDDALDLTQAVSMVRLAPLDKIAPVDLNDVTHGILTARELQILQLLVQGKSNAEIAGTLFISLRTAQTHVTHILAKLGVSSRTEAAVFAVRNALV